MFIFIKFIHLTSVVVWVGTMIFFTFLAAPAIFKKFERQRAGEVVGVVFPLYWIVGYAMSIVSLVTLLYLVSITGLNVGGRLKVIVAMTILSFVSGLVIGKRARKIKAVMNAETNEAQKAEYRLSFGKIHAVSAIFNLTIIALGVVLLYMMAGDMVI